MFDRKEDEWIDRMEREAARRASSQPMQRIISAP
jgi:hypothetical protein